MATAVSGFREAPAEIFIRLRGLYPSLKTALRKVGEAVLSQPEMAVYASVHELAARARVSEATVMRFCRTLGFKGFQDFKIALAREIVASGPPAEVIDRGQPAALAREVFQTHMAALHDTLRVLDLEGLILAAQALVQARRLWFVGVGASNTIAAYAHSRFVQLGLPVSWCPDAHLMKMAASLSAQGDVVVVISHSGSTPEPLEIARLARQVGARVICVTRNPLSPLSLEADLVLLAASRDGHPAQVAAASRLPELAVIDSLFALAAAARPEQTRDNLAKVDRAVSRKY